MEALKQIGMNIRVLRVRRHLSQEQLAVESRVERAFMGRIERGETNMSVGTLLKLMATLEAAPQAIFQDVDFDSIHNR